MYSLDRAKNWRCSSLEHWDRAERTEEFEGEGVREKSGDSVRTTSPLPMARTATRPFPLFGTSCTENISSSDSMMSRDNSDVSFTMDSFEELVIDWDFIMEEGGEVRETLGREMGTVPSFEGRNGPRRTWMGYTTRVRRLSGLRCSVIDVGGDLLASISGSRMPHLSQKHLLDCVCGQSLPGSA